MECLGIPQALHHVLGPHLKTPVLWTGWEESLLKAEKINQMLKQVQHDVTIRFWSIVIPNLFRDLGFGLRILCFKAAL